MATITDFNGDDFQAAIASGTVLVDFWAPWCGPCKMQGGILETHVAPKAGDDVTILKVNVDENQELAAEFGIQSIPALLVFKNGEQVAEFQGVTRPDDLLDVLA
ncbi:MAG: thioredoxin [Kiritimatiellae bacterium]|nr:thioredoxin [Kiritimatiellia bacterium]